MIPLYLFGERPMLLINPTLLKTAAEVLPTCKSLTDAEVLLGGAWLDGERDKQEAAVVWGLFDGWTGRPSSDSCGLGLPLDRTYHQAVEAGRKLSTAKLPG